MIGIGRHSFYKTLIAPLLILAILIAPAGAVHAASGPVTFKVRRGPLRVRLLLPVKPVRGRPAIIRAVVRNVGKRHLKAGTVELSIRPRGVYLRAIKRMKVLPAGSRRRFAWRVKFRKPRVYILTVVAKARREGPARHVAGAKKRIKVRRRANALSLFALNMPKNPAQLLISLKYLVSP